MIVPCLNVTVSKFIFICNFPIPAHTTLHRESFHETLNGAEVSHFPFGRPTMASRAAIQRQNSPFQQFAFKQSNILPKEQEDLPKFSRIFKTSGAADLCPTFSNVKLIPFLIKFWDFGLTPYYQMDVLV